MDFLSHRPQTALSSHTGVMLLPTGEESLLARLALINSARKSLDLQYYAINNDLTSNLLVEAILKAADRGVPVRLLIDDISIGKIQKQLSALDSVENFDVKIFNPISRDDQSLPARLINFIVRLPKATKRMHNKALVADGAACITGGRNLGDEYFDAHKDMSFKDLDVFSIGPAAIQVTESFEAFWNDRASHSIADLYTGRPRARYIARLRRKLEKSARRSQKKDGPRHLDVTFESYMKNPARQFKWVDCAFLSDPPGKVHDANPGHSVPGREIFARFKSVRSECLIVSPYFVPGDDGADILSDMVARGAGISVLTNSLASTDVVAVHRGYRTYRTRLLVAGIKLFEMMPVNGRRARQRLLGRTAPSYASLHAKFFVFDRKTSAIGSLNFDPRSIELNTESALFIDDEETAATLARLFLQACAPQTSWSVSYGKRLCWTGVLKGRARRLHREPYAGLWRRFQVFLTGFLRVEKQL